MGTNQGIDRLIRKEVSLGAIRDKPVPEDHIGLTQIAPFKDVESDDVIFDYIKGGLSSGLAPARAEDAEAELAQKDDLLYGSGRAAVIDWSLKDRYAPSDVTRYREDLFIAEKLKGLNTGQSGQQLIFSGRAADGFAAKMARDDNMRRRKLDNRMEWLIMQGLSNGTLTYNDGKIKFTVNYGRPAGQHNQAPAGGLWSTPNCDPIGDLLGVSQTMYDTYGVRPTKGIISKRIANSFWKSSRFLAAVGVPVVGGTPSLTLDPNYLGLNGYSPQGALAIVEAQTGITFTIYDGLYRTRPIGGTTYTNNRFTPDNQLILRPSDSDIDSINALDIGFAGMLTAPHPEGNFQSGYYEWEDVTKDPWNHVRGSGIKAFPIFPFMELTYTMTVL